jgi:hypothetical protein
MRSLKYISLCFEAAKTFWKNDGSVLVSLDAEDNVEYLPDSINFGGKKHHLNMSFISSMLACILPLQTKNVV